MKKSEHFSLPIYAYSGLQTVNKKNMLEECYLLPTHFLSSLTYYIRKSRVCILGGVKLACKDPSFAQSLVIFANQTWQLLEWPFLTLTYMFYKLPIQIQTVEGALQYKIAPLTPPKCIRMQSPSNQDFAIDCTYLLMGTSFAIECT